jgi:fructose-1,6-bisphosphatase/inositol monophosphatase family enzyme
VDDPVAAAIRQAADAAIVTRFRLLVASDVTEKTPGDYVTTADHECEELLTKSLGRIHPGVPVLGEEAAAVDPGLTERLFGHDRLWVLDPLDGTRAFVNGDADFAVMVALVEQGETTAAWIWQPIPRLMFSARRGHGAFREGVRIRRPSEAETPVADLHGVAKLGFVPDDLRYTILANRNRLADVAHGPASAGFCYPQLVEGVADFTLFWRTLPWDHAPGALIAQEAGCHVARLDASTYRPDRPGQGLLAAADPITWLRVHDTLLR